MDKTEKLAFMQAYQKAMAYLAQDKVDKLLNQNQSENDLDCSPDETTVFDALSIWNSAIDFALTQKGANHG